MAPPTPDYKRSILIIGGGTFGLSTAYELARAGYTDITVLEKDSQIPSRFSAGYDLNKIIRAEYADPFYTDLSVDAIRRWQSDPLYKPFYHERGYLNVVSAAAPEATKQGLARYRESIEQHPAFGGKISAVDGRDAVRRLVSQFTGPVNGWTGYYNKMAGYAHSKNAMEAVYKACLELGTVRFHTGPQEGEVQSLLYAEGGTSASPDGQTQQQQRTCIGAMTRDGRIHRAATTIVSAGASVVGLMPHSVGSQLGIAARCWGVVHIQLTADEAAALRGIPVTMVRDLAFFFEPDRATHKLKFCHMGGGYHRSQGQGHGEGAAPPPARLADSQYVPEIDVEHVRRLLREVLPQLAERPLVDAHLCWIADSGDSDFVIDYVPGSGGSLVVTTGDSGHGFKMLPVFGGFVRKLLESGGQDVEKWRWKDGSGGGASGELNGVKNWRNGGGRDLADVARAKL
ncbi:FAD dependent oxidoreductase [Microdochium bolleyi]|uniref:FAD dependent oxidoreductase n=1 Tax=Microdochium bolleyi TaxID=196109 RepID=A0A136IZF3_9PEZI|nr:FAD dependent oxidoreductase [Microdochium bolleyi]